MFLELFFGMYRQNFSEESLPEMKNVLLFVRDCEPRGGEIDSGHINRNAP